jgi:hypothetical protein
MAGKDSSVSPYLLRPLRTLAQVLGGSSDEVEPGSCRIEVRQTCDGRNEQAKASIDASRARRSADLPQRRLQP